MQPEARYCRTWQDVARACGLVRLYAKRLMRLKQQQEVLGWTRQPDFPKRQRHGWLRAEVVAWDQRRKGVVTAERAPAAGERGAEDLFGDNAALDQARRLAIRRDYSDGKPPAHFKKFQRHELVAAKIPEDFLAKVFGPEASAADLPAEVPRSAAGYAGIARVLNLYYSGRVKITIRRQDVEQWKRGERLPTGAPTFPPAKDSNRYDTAECVAWFDRYLLPVHGVSGAGAGDLFNFSELEALRGKGEKERLEHEAWLREQERNSADKNYIRLDESLLLARSAAIAASRLTTQALEESLPAAVLALAELPPMDEAARAKLRSALRAAGVRVNAELQVKIANALTENAENLEKT